MCKQNELSNVLITRPFALFGKPALRPRDMPNMSVPVLFSRAPSVALFDVPHLNVRSPDYSPSYALLLIAQRCMFRVLYDTALP